MRYLLDDYEYMVDDSMVPSGDVYAPPVYSNYYPPNQYGNAYPVQSAAYSYPQQQYGYTYPQQNDQATQQYNWYYYTYLPWLRQVQAAQQAQASSSSYYNNYAAQCAAQNAVWNGSQCVASQTTLQQQCVANQGVWNSLTNTCGTSIAQQCAAQGGTYLKTRDGIAICCQVATQYAPVTQNEYALHMYIAQALANGLIQQTVSYANISAFDMSGNSSYRTQKFLVPKGKTFTNMNFTQVVAYLQKNYSTMK